jgi:Protein of unknown function (DUF2809)
MSTPPIPEPSFMSKSLSYRLLLLLSILVIVPVGYLIRFSSLTPDWLPDLMGSLAYEIFWVLGVVLLWPRVSLRGAAVGVCLATCGLEFLQLWQAPELMALRQTFLGRLILGNTFTWSDFPAYFLGSFCGWLWARSLKLQTQIPKN